MKNKLQRLGRAGFTLIEILVVLILLSVLAAAVFPVVTQQIGQSDAPRLSNDLQTIRSALEVFQANVRKFPGDLDDLVFQISTADSRVDDATGPFTYSTGEVNRWNGPYIDVSLTDGDVSTGTAFNSGFSAAIDYDLGCVDDAIGAPVFGTCATGEFVTIQVTSTLTEQEFSKVNSIFDPVEDSFTFVSGSQAGKFRCTVSGTTCTTSYLLTAPWRK